jgi:hypothetical protein
MINTLGLFYPEDPTGQQSQSNRLVTARWQTATGWSSEQVIGGAVAFTADIWKHDITAVQLDQGPPFLQLFYPGYDGGVRSISTDSSSPSGWTAEQNLGGNPDPDTAAIAAVVAPGPLLELFYRGNQGGVSTIWRDPSSGLWQPEQNLGGTPAGAVTAIVAPDTDVVQLFYADSQTGVYTIVGNNPGGLGPTGWSPPRQIAGTHPQPISDITAILVPGADGTQVVQLFYIGLSKTDTNVYTLMQDPDGTWPANPTPQNLGGTLAFEQGSDIMAIHIPGTELVQVFYPGGPQAYNGEFNVCSIAQNPDGSWAAEQNLGGTPQTDITAVVDPDTKLIQLFYVGIPEGANNVACCTLAQITDQTWSTQASLGGGIPSAAIIATFNFASDLVVAAADSPLPATTRLGVEQLDVFWLGTAGDIMTAVSDPSVNNGAWQGFPITGTGAAAPTSPLTALTRYDKQLDVFWIGNDGSVWTGSADPSIANDNWQVLPVAGPGAASAGSPLAVTTRFDTQQLGVFWFGDDGAVWTGWSDPNIDSGAWHSLAITGPAAAAPNSQLIALTRFGTQLDVFWVAGDGSVWTAFADPSIANDSWQLVQMTLPGLAAPGSAVAVTTRFDVQQLDAFWLGPDGTMWSAFADPTINNGAWQAFPIPGAAAAAPGSPVTALTRFGSQLDVFWIAGDGSVWTAFADPNIDNDSWQTFPISSAGVASPSSPLAATTRFDVGQLDVFWWATDGTVWTAVADPTVNNGDWQAFPLPGGALAASDSPITALTRYGVELDVFWIASDRTIWSAAANPNIGSGSWQALAIT